MDGTWKTLNDRLIYWYGIGGEGDQYPEITVEADGYWDLVHIGARLRWSQAIDYIKIGLTTGIMPAQSLGYWKIPQLPTTPDESGYIQTYVSLGVGHSYYFDVETGLVAGLPPIRLSSGNKITIHSNGVPDEYQYFATLVVTLRKYDPPAAGGGGIGRSLYKDATGYIIP